MSKCVFSTLGSSFLGASAATACAYYYPPAGAPPPPPPIMPINGPRELMSSYCLNQLGLAGGQVPVESYLIDGQSRFSFIGLRPVDF